MLAVAITGLFLLLWGVPEDAPAQQTPGGTVADTAAVTNVTDTAAVRDSVLDTMRADPGRSVEEATSTVRRFALDFTTLLPKILIALGLLLAAGIIVRLVRAVLRRVLGEWEKADAATAMAGILIWLLAIGIALSVIAGDTRTLIGSVGLLGLALSWALQAPIESFAGHAIFSSATITGPGSSLSSG